MILELTEDSRIGIYAAEGLATCRKCLTLQRPHGVYSPSGVGGLRTNHRLYVCEKCMPTGRPILDLSDQFPNIEKIKAEMKSESEPWEDVKDPDFGKKTAVAFVRRQLRKSRSIPIKTKELIRNDEGYTEYAIRMAIFHLKKRGEIKQVAHGQHVMNDVDPIVIRTAGDIDIKAVVLKAISAKPGASITGLQQAIAESDGHEFCLRTLRRHAMSLINEDLVYRERSSASASYKFYAIDPNEEAC